MLIQDNEKSSQCHHPKWWKVSSHWFLARNSKNPSYTGPTWAMYFYGLVYIPEKEIFENGYHQELLKAENTKKKVYTFCAMILLIMLFRLLDYLTL